MPAVRLVGVEAGGTGLEPGHHAARFAGGSAGILQGTRTFVLQDADGNIEATHSISAGLDYAAVGPEHAWLRERGRTEYVQRQRRRGARGVQRARPARGHPARAGVGARGGLRRAGWPPRLGAGRGILVNLSGRGDKDVQTVASAGRERSERHVAH